MKLIERKAAALVISLLKEEPTRSLMEKLKYHDEYTYRHSINVAIYTCMLAYEADIYYKKETVLGALLHDIGKLDVPESVIKKTSKLTDTEIRILKHHPMYSYQILDDNGYSSLIREIGLLHHEKIDGSGYPSGIKALNENVQVVSICDMYDAMTTDRPYHHKFSHDQAYTTLLQDVVNGKLNKHYLEYLTTHAKHGLNNSFYINEEEIAKITFMDASEVFAFISACDRKTYSIHLCSEAERVNAKSLISVCRLTKFSNLSIVATPMSESDKESLLEELRQAGLRVSINCNEKKHRLTRGSSQNKTNIAI